MAPHFNALAWKIPWTEEPGRLQSDTTERLHFHFSLSCIGEGNGNPLQCSCLENPRDGGACWAAVYGVAQNRTRLKRLSSSSSSVSFSVICLAYLKNLGINRCCIECKIQACVGLLLLDIYVIWKAYLSKIV